jgi:DNA-binding transcriptional ArsR family regulator
MPAPDVFQAIANPTRRALLGFLRGTEIPATALADRFDLTQPAISQQLRVLKAAGLVAERRVGRQRLYHLNPAPLRAVADWIAQYEHFWQEAFDRLDNYLKTEDLKRRADARQRTPRTRTAAKGSRR